MGNSWTQNYYHAVFSTKDREPWIRPELERRLHAVLGGIAKDLNCVPLAINGMPEHVHVLVRFPSDLALSDLLRHLKSRSSKWGHEEFADLGHFAWQQGYGGFTVSKTSVEHVEAYIRGQKEHHLHSTFENEYLSMLRRAGWDGDAADVFR